MSKWVFVVDFKRIDNFVKILMFEVKIGLVVLEAWFLQHVFL